MIKILILKPQDICYGIVEVFAEHFGNALTKKGIEVQYYDLKTEPLENLADAAQGNHAAVIDFYSGLLSVKTSGGEYLWNCSGAPVFQLCLDFPIYIMDRLEAGLKNHYALCMDKHFCSIIQECLPDISGTYFFPMAGSEGKRKIPWEKRSHDIIFIGTFTDYRERLLKLSQCEEGIKQIGYAFFCMMREHVELDQKQAFERTLAQFNIQLNRQEFYQWLNALGQIAESAAFYQREQVIRTLLQAGFQVEVFGDSWLQSPFAEDSNLVIHEQVNEDGYISVMENTKLSLNVSYCNHAGYSERYSYAMLNGAVCVSDKTEYLGEEFADGEDIIFYDLNHLHELPEKISRLLQHPEESQEIADAAYKKAEEKHTWEERAERFLHILEQIYGKIAADH